MIIIPCGMKKIKTDKPVQAKDLYCGSLFTTLLSVAQTLDTDIRILSAGYGLLKLNDMVLPYDRKINAAISLQLKNLLAPLNLEGYSLLPYTYNLVFQDNEKIISLLPERVSLGFYIQAAMKLKKDKVLTDLKYEDGEIAERLQATRQSNRTGKSLGIVKTIKEAFLTKAYSVYEMDEHLRTVIGPPLGTSYLPTIRSQLKMLPEKFNYDVIKESGKFQFKNRG